jgi:FkbM family methyltransferase
MRFSKLARPDVRAIAFEPVPATFHLLASNSMCFPNKNVTLINAAVSNCSACHGIKIPKFQTGANNYYAAYLSNNNDNFRVFCITIDSLDIPHPISLIKVDVEGHEFEAIEGMENLLERDKPVLIIEGSCSEVDKLLKGLGYSDKNCPIPPTKSLDILNNIHRTDYQGSKPVLASM